MKQAFASFIALSLFAAPVFAQVERASEPVAKDSSQIKGAQGLTVLIGAIAASVTVILLVDDSDDDDAVSG